MDIYVVYDITQTGRLIGAFLSKEKAERIAKINNEHYRIHVCEIEKLNQNSLEWLPGNEAVQIKKLVSEPSTW